MRFVLRSRNMLLICDYEMKSEYIYHFFLDARTGGPHAYVLNKTNYFKDEFFQVFYTSGKGDFPGRALINLRHIMRALYPLEIILNVLLILFDYFSGRILRENIIFNIHGGASLSPIIAARILKIPVLWTIHETVPSYKFLIKVGRWILGNKNSYIAVVSKRSAAVYGLSNAIFLPASVDESFWMSKSVTNTESIECNWSDLPGSVRSSIRVLMVGNLNPLKGADVLIDALSASKGGFNLKIVGRKLKTHQTFVDSLTEKAQIFERSGCDRRVDFLGWQSQERVRALLASCDIFILPSLSEACPVALLEAMAIGCRIVAADVGDVRAMLGNCPNSIIFEAGCVRELVKAIEETQLRIDFEDEIQKKSCVGPEWKISRVVEETAIVYRRLLDSCN